MPALAGSPRCGLFSGSRERFAVEFTHELIEGKIMKASGVRDSYENSDRLNQIDDGRSIFIRSGESGFMIYCVKTPALSAKGATCNSPGQRPG